MFAERGGVIDFPRDRAVVGAKTLQPSGNADGVQFALVDQGRGFGSIAVLPADRMRIEINVVRLGPDLLTGVGVESQHAFAACDAIGDENPTVCDDRARPSGP